MNPQTIVALYDKRGNPVTVSSQGGGVFALDVNIAGGGGSGGTSSNFGGAFPSAGTAAGFIDSGGNMAGGNLDASGNLKIAGTFSATPVYSHTLNQGGLQTVTTAAVLLADNHSGGTPRVGWSVQNISTVVVLVLLGAGALSATNYTFALPACGIAGDGSSPIYRDTQWQGQVQILAASGTGKVAFGEYV